MSIRSVGHPHAAPRPVAPAAPAAPAEPGAKSKVGGPPAHAPAHGYRARHDSVAISDDARALAAAGDETRTAALSAERVQDLRRKVLEGAYNQAGVVDQVARRLLAGGDV
jgi:hypothetical protein